MEKQSALTGRLGPVVRLRRRLTISSRTGTVCRSGTVCCSGTAGRSGTVNQGRAPMHFNSAPDSTHKLINEKPKEHKMKTLCFTGHRKIGGVYHGPLHVALERHLVSVVERAYVKGFRNFISGGALGVDQIAARAVLRARLTHPDIVLIIAKPFPSQSSKWPAASQAEFNRICDQANKVYEISPDPYASWKMQRRNIWMVDPSNAVAACWDGGNSGGTFNCVEYARAKEKSILVIHPTLLTERWI